MFKNMTETPDKQKSKRVCQKDTPKKGLMPKITFRSPFKSKKKLTPEVSQKEIPEILKDKDVQKFIFGEQPFRDAKDEKAWGNQLYKKFFEGKKNTSQWTTKVGEGLIRFLLEAQGKRVWIPEAKETEVSGTKYKPDLETEDAIWEVKTRSYCTKGTAGEKILGTPLKYSEIQELYGKPLKIVLLGYQEVEAIEKFKLFDMPEDSNKYKMLKFFESMGITYVKGSDLLKAILDA